jgi:AraC-like DNA-binding protein
MIPYAAMGRLLSSAVAATGCQHLGLLVGERCGVAEIGAVGSLAASAWDVETALRDFTRHIAAFDHGCAVSLSVAGGAASFTYVLLDVGVAAREQIIEGAVAIMVRVIRDLVGGFWSPERVLLPHRARGALTHYRKFFRAPVEFGTGRASVEFPARWLAVPVNGSDRALRHALLLQVNEAGGRKDLPLTATVRRQIHLALHDGQAGEADIALSMAMDSSTLRRQLAREGTSFRAVTQHVQFDVARYLLRETDLLLVEIALLLGYAETSVFTRAFTRWAGMAPSEWRKANSRVTSA